MCIEAQDADTLVRIPGVGRKTAERLLIEMRDRVKGFRRARELVPLAGGRNSQAAIGPQAEAFSALVALGYKPAEVTRLLKAVDRVGADDRRTDPRRAAGRGSDSNHDRAGPHRIGRHAGRRRSLRSRRAAEAAGRLRRPDGGQDADGDLHPGGAQPARGARSRADLRPAGSGQDHARATSSPTSWA